MKVLANFRLISLLSLIGILSIGCSSSDSPPPTPPPEPFKAYLKASNTSAGDLFGRAVAISGNGNTIAIGAINEDGDEGIPDPVNTGAVYVFKRNPVDTGTWSQVAYVKAPTPTADDEFGFSVALSEDGSVLAVGAPMRDTGIVPTNDTGAVFIYTGPNYDTATERTASDAASGDRFGQSIALSDNGMYLAVGANTKIFDPLGTPVAGAGAAYIYEDDGTGTNWSNERIFTATVAAEADAGFGTSVALNQDGSVLAIGEWLKGNAPATVDYGAVYVFKRSGNVWVADPPLEVGVAHDRFGSAVSLNDAGNRLAVGAPGDFLGTAVGSVPNTGKVYIYTFGITWTLDAGVPVTASNGENDDAFGGSVALDSSGNTLLVGAWLEDGAGTYIGTPDIANAASGAGAAYRFERSATPTWDETEYIKATNTETGDEFGSVAISDDGLHILAGASGEDSDANGIDGDQNNNNALDSGAAYFYDL